MPPAASQRRATQQLHLRLLLQLLLAAASARGASMRWCEYLKAIGAVSDECQPDSHSLEVQRQMEMKLQYPDYNLCTGRYAYCSASEECESGMACRQTFTDEKCCTSPYSQCPTVDELGYACLKRHPTNWCFRDDDCAAGRSNRYLCCPTGCNYNVCVRARGPTHAQRLAAAVPTAPGAVSKPPTWQQNSLVWNYARERELAKRARQKVQTGRLGGGDEALFPEPSACPPAVSLAVTCYRRRSVSWCDADRDCRPTAYGHRICCETPCGNSMCVAQLSDGAWVIG